MTNRAPCFFCVLEFGRICLSKRPVVLLRMMCLSKRRAGLLGRMCFSKGRVVLLRMMCLSKRRAGLLGRICLSKLCAMFGCLDGCACQSLLCCLG